MNLKNCITKSEKHYTPHKLRSRPIRCLSLPILGLFLFMLFWFVACPLFFVSLLKQHKDWPKEWPYYYWTVALIVFVILLAILVCLWRFSHNSDEVYKTESDLLLNNAPAKNRKASKQNEVYMISINTIQRSQDKLDVEPNNITEKQNCSVSIRQVEEKLGENRKSKLENSVPLRKAEKAARPDSLVIPPARETQVELHSTSSPLTPRELFFWDLIQSANKCRNSTTFNFIEHEKQKCSLGYFSLSSPKSDDESVTKPSTQKQTRSSGSSTEYFIANVPDRRSLTAEVFLYVDGGQEEKRLRIRNEDCGDDDVFKN